MVSVLPAHIALEMKNEMLKKIRNAQLKSFISNHNSIDDGYTMRNKNVSPS